jgi:hypothetical protein
MASRGIAMKSKRFSINYIWIVLAVAVLAGTLITLAAETVKTVQLSKKDVTDIVELLDENEVYLRKPVGFESGKNGYFYYLDRQYNVLMKVEKKTLKLAKSFSKKGEGPFEHRFPGSLRVKNGKIYVLDFTYSGIRIFDMDLNPVKEMRFGTYLEAYQLFNGDLLGKFNRFDVSTKGEIYIRAYDSKTKTALQVIDSNGKLARNLLPVSASFEKDIENWAIENLFSIQLDSRDNLMILYPKDGVLKMFTSQGKLIRERILYQDIPNNERHPNPIFKVISNNPGMQITIGLDFYGFELVQNDQFVVNTYSGFYFYNSYDWKLVTKIKKKDIILYGEKFIFEDGKIWTLNEMANVPKFK